MKLATLIEKEFKVKIDPTSLYDMQVVMMMMMMTHVMMIALVSIVNYYYY